MPTYLLRIEEHPEGKIIDRLSRLPSAIASLAVLEDWTRSGSAVPTIERDGEPIDEATLRADAAAER